MKCPLCNLNLEKEKIFYKNKNMVILRTKDLKGHRERIMVINRKHTKNISNQFKEQAISKLIEIGRKIIKKKFCVMSDRHSRIRNHWHRVASDFWGEDIKQMNKTPKDAVIEIDWQKITVKIARRIRKAKIRHDKLKKFIADWFKKQGYQVICEWYDIDIVAYKLGEDDIQELIGVEVKTWKSNSQINPQISKAIYQAKKFKKFVDKFFIAFKKSEMVWGNDIPEWIGIINISFDNIGKPIEPVINRDAKCERVELPFYAINWWKDKFLLRKFKIPKAYKLTTRHEMEEKLRDTIEGGILSKALRIQMLKATPSLEEIKEQIEKPFLPEGQTTLIKYWS